MAEQGNGCTDCLAAAFCSPCTLAQMEMEIKDRARNQQTGIDVKNAGYTSQQQGMVYQLAA